MNLVQRLLTEIAKKRKRVVVVGDAMTDVWVHGYYAECQDECPKLVEESRVEVPGGAANAAHCLSNWGTYTDLYTYPREHYPTKYRFITNDGKIAMRWDSEVPATEDARSPQQWAREFVAEMVICARAVLLSDYDKGFLTPGFIREVVDLCNHRGIPCVADAKRVPSWYAGTILKCNSDYQHLHNDALFDWTEDRRGLVVTAGKLNPVMWQGSESMGLGYDLPPVLVKNHVGAGDCFAAHLALALAYGFSLKDAAALAHSAGRVYVQHLHNRPPHTSEIEADMGQQ